MNTDELENWLRGERVDDVNCLIPDMSGAVRGKSMTSALFMNGVKTGGLRAPESTYAINVHGDFTFNDHIRSTENDLVLAPDLETVRLEPWNADPTACFICDTLTDDGAFYPLAPRQVLRSVVSLYKEKGWTPIIGPEVEFYLISKFKEPILEPQPAEGQSGLKDYGQHVMSLDAIDEFAPLFDDFYHSCEAQHIVLDTLIHEDGPCQFEINIRHDEAMKVADQLYLFKRLARQVAMRHDMFVTFMAKPYADCSGSALHLHQSVVNAKTGENIFSNEDGRDTDLFRWYIGGLQQYLLHVIPLFAPYTNSYNRFQAYMSAPTNTHWSRENRTVGFRVPQSAREARRVENRIGGSDVNPYLALAASLLCGYIGMTERLDPAPEYIGEGYIDDKQQLPSSLMIGLERFRGSKTIRRLLGDAFVETYAEIKQTEHEHRASILSPWDIRYLLTNI